MSIIEFKKALNALNTNEVALRDSYDAVFHLVSAAKGAEEYYTLSNNPARFEDIEEAVIKDAQTLNAWVGHPHLRVIDNSTDFERKMRRLMAEISSFLGEAGPYEIERKFLIEFPKLETLEKSLNCQKVEIIQTYLSSQDGEETRVRQRGLNGNFIYIKTNKRRISDVKRIETEKSISKEEYLRCLLDAEPQKDKFEKLDTA